MIYGIGCDIVNVERLKAEQTFLDHFIKRSFSKAEKEVYAARKFANDQQKALYIAKRFAAKEAVAKALGTGFRNGLCLADIEIFNDELGKPQAILSENAKVILQQKGVTAAMRIYVSLSDDFPFAQAVAVIEI